jgi:hypothetical protein
MTPFFGLDAVQLALHVPDIEVAAQQLAARHGWGPFFWVRDIRVSRCVYRGQASSFHHSSAFGQGGDLMIELITQADDTPSVLRERFAAHETGVHHVAVFTPNLDAFLAARLAEGSAVALDATTDLGPRFAMVEALPGSSLLVEAYEPSPQLDGFYALVRTAAQGWDGRDPVRPIG